MPSHITTYRLLIAATVLIVIDQITKMAVRFYLDSGEIISLIGSLLKITFNPNYSGFSWLVPPMPGWVVIIFHVLLFLIGAFLFLFYLYYSDRVRRSAWTAIGIVGVTASVGGHLADYLFVPFATDFIRIYNSPTANLADLYSYMGIIAIAIESIWVYRNGMSTSLSRHGFIGYIKDVLNITKVKR